MKLVKVAVVQGGGILFDAEAGTAKAERLLVETTRADLVVFPEAFIGGYPKGHDFGARVGSRTLEGHKTFRRYYEGSIDVPGPATERLGDAARAAGAWVVIGVIERDGAHYTAPRSFSLPMVALPANTAS
jgi:nitrilase